MGPEDLAQILKALPIQKDPRVLVGIETSDDAGIYQLTDEVALVQTVDFFTPIVDDPFTFGQIAAANALSDVYAMGGTPLTAMNLVAFPIHSLPSTILKEILRGGLSKLEEAQVALVGGHSIEDKEIKYGLAVTGMVHPHRYLTNAKAKEGDQLVLTKPLGTGIMATALKAEMASQEAIQKMVESMITLNRKASELMMAYEAHACTDITGFGLIGHALEMAKASQIGMIIQAEKVPIFSEALEYAKNGLIPGGAYSNRKYFSCHVEVDPKVPEILIDLFYDPQTSGGLLISLPPENSQRLVEALRNEGVPNSSIIGEVVGGPLGRIQII